jgi:general secretion pathway protein G
MRIQHQARRQARRAFTLMEMLVVVAIIVMLAGIGGYYFVQSYEDSKRSAAKVQTKVLTEACDAYRLSHGTNPPSLQSLLVGDEEGGPYLKTQEALMDPWKGQYQYNAQGPNNGGRQPDIWANAPNGQQIGNWAGSK